MTQKPNKGNNQALQDRANSMQYRKLNTRIDYLQEILIEIREKLNNPDYNIFLTIPKPVDCIGKCQITDSDTYIDSPDSHTSAQCTHINATGGRYCPDCGEIIPTIPWE